MMHLKRNGRVTSAVIMAVCVWFSAGPAASALAGTPSCADAFIVAADPPSGTVDARQPVALLGTELLGIGSADEPIIITLDPQVAAPPQTDPNCWNLCETSDGGYGPNFVSSVTDLGDNMYAIVLDRPITPNEATVLTFLGNPVDEIVYISHPANTDGDLFAAPADVLFVVDMLNNQASPPHGIYSQDIDRSDFFGAPDVLRTVDLLNGADTFPEQLFTPRPNPAFCLSPKLTLEVEDECPGGEGTLFQVELWMRDLPHEVTGFQAFVSFDPDVLAYQGGAYTPSPFPLHVQDLNSAEINPGLVNADGSTTFDGTGEDDDSLLAILFFEVLEECETLRIDFGQFDSFVSQISFEGVPINGILVPTQPLTFDGDPPMITCPADVETSADPGENFAIVNYPDPVVTDGCDDEPVASCEPESGSSFPIGTTPVTCTATDSCANESECTFFVTVNGR